MILQTYKEKRNFKKTPEPAGDIPHGGRHPLVFVVQKHAASHLHFDFRLEAEGVLKSWAVPKGVSLDPSVKRLAMMVEDHPFEYRTFEGIIPKGNYGAGTVMVWDQGIYYADPDADRKHNEAAIVRGLKKGRLTLFMDGHKLHGWFSLVKMRRSKGKDNEWLLMKKPDEYSGEDKMVADVSASSGRTMEEIAGGNGHVSKKTKTAPDAETAGKKAPLRTSIKPMLATLTDKAFDRSGWIYEIKWDGFRALGEVKKGKVRLYSRNDKNFNDQFPIIADELKGVKEDIILDGEVVILDAEGRSNFQSLQNYMKTGDGQLVYYVFDILYYNGRDLTGVPLRERKKILDEALPDLPLVRISEYVEEKGTKFFQAAKKAGLEGIIAKNSESVYEEGRRSKNWLKIKIVQEQEAVICGFTEPSGGRKYFGALILGVFKGKELQYIGHCGGGFDYEGLRSLYDKLKPLETARCPLTTQPKTNTKAHWVKPKLICQVKFGEWTQEGIMRQPIFLGLRDDKAPQEIKHEEPKPVEKILESPEVGQAQADGHITQKFSNIDKVFWPTEGYTKGDVIEYYKIVSAIILPYLKDRPQSLNRHPNGINQPNFFQKDVEGKVADWIKTVPIFSESNDKEIRYMVCNDRETLLYMANLGCIELNVWNSRVQSLDRPDYMVLDFDPLDIGFEKVIEAVLVAHEILEKIGVLHLCKTSGATGIHIYVPLGAKYTYEQSKEFALLINTLVHKRLPKTTSLERNPQKRKKKIYLDYLQNREAQTMVAPYCLRPKPKAPVSTPLLWEEVNKKLKPGAFNIKTIMKRIDRHGDLWKSLFKKAIDMDKALGKLERIYQNP